jgi:mono/diheme cytochrome c family protein
LFACSSKARGLRGGAGSRPAASRLFETLAALAVTLMLAGCRQDMHDQPRYRPLAASTFFADGRSARPAVPGTIARGHLRTDAKFYKGRDGANLVAELPIPVTREVLNRGRERFNIYCSPCHSRTGDGEGMVVQRGFRHPPTFHQERLHNAPVGHFYDVITNGFGAMASYASRIPVNDRWAIVAYVRALQLSHNATIDDVPPAERSKLEAAPAGGQR